MRRVRRVMSGPNMRAGPRVVIPSRAALAATDEASNDDASNTVGTRGATAGEVIHGGEQPVDRDRLLHHQPFARGTRQIPELVRPTAHVERGTLAEGVGDLVREIGAVGVGKRDVEDEDV